MLKRSVLTLMTIALLALTASLRPAEAAMPTSWLGLSVTYIEDGYSLRPAPSKFVRELKVHTPDPVSINKLWIKPDWADWILGGKTNRYKMEADEVVARPSALARMGSNEGKTDYKVTSLRFAHLKLLLGNKTISLPAGEMSFAEDGTLAGVQIELEPHLLFDLRPQDGKLQLLFSTSGWKWNVLPALNFDQISATGGMDDDGFYFDKIGATGLGGAIEGRLRVAVSDDFALEGDLHLGKLNAPSLLAKFFGNQPVQQGLLSADFKLSARGASMAELASQVSSKGSFMIQSGAIERFGLLEGLRLPGPGLAGGGLTKFQKLDGSFSWATGKPVSIVLRNLDGGALQASGAFVIQNDGSLRGNISGALSLPNGGGKLRALSLRGTVKAPELFIP
ncbi:hypothetical protein [Uliginosibacterium sediminicola]|uniref:AsmA-like C-terminal domain-containing protein n=1 Tax=Uliginosibacterium sediminicola TaxID=2024550 RepID=A0ABU9Z3I7_9RHOO